jgi:hypothetical protein
VKDPTDPLARHAAERVIGKRTRSIVDVLQPVSLTTG